MEAVGEGMEDISKGVNNGAQILELECDTRILVKGVDFPEQAGERCALAL